MFSKKIAQLGFIIASITSLSFGSIYAMETNKEIIKSNTVYSTSNQSVKSPDNQTTKTSGVRPPSVSSEAKDCYRKLSAEALKKYFNISDINPEKQDILVVDENYITASKEYSKQSLLERTDLSAEQLEQMLASLDGPNPHEYIMKGYNHAFAQSDYVDDKVAYSATFNANTKEIITLNIDFEPQITYDENGEFESYQHSSVKNDQNIDPNSFTSLATDYITAHQLGDITTPKFVKATQNSDAYLLFEDANDSSKKAIVTVNTKLNKVNGFYIKTAATFWYNSMFEVKSGRNL